MTVVQLRCPGCGASVNAEDGAAQVCQYCNAPLLVDAPGVEMEIREEHYVTLELVGPSNRERVAQLLAAELSIEVAAAEALAGELPADVGAFARAAPAAELRGQLEDAGAIARVGMRVVKTPRPPRRDVVLEDAGVDALAVIKAIRAHLPLGLREAKDLVDSAPCELARALDGPRAEALQRELAAAGAKVRLA